MTSGWEAWLRERYAAYLLKAAKGEPREPAAVAEALSRLTHQAGALTRLAALHFLLDRERGPERLLLRELPHYLPRALPTSRRELVTRRGSPPGRVSWPRTAALRQQSGDPTLFVGSVARRTFDTLELRLVRWLLHAVQGALRDVATFFKGDRVSEKSWASQLPPLEHTASEFLKHAALRDLQPDPLTHEQRAHVAYSPYDAVKAAVQLADFHDEIRPIPRTVEALAEVVGRHALAPNGAPRRFELFSLLAVLASVSRVWPTAVRRDSLIEPGRQHVAEWTAGTWRLRLHYDHGAPSSRYYQHLCGHYLGGRSQPLRPDLRLELRGPDGLHRELYLDAKLSEDDRDGYYRGALLELLGKTGDRPHVFTGDGLRGVLICGSHVVGVPDPAHAFAFVGPDGCTTPEGPLDALLHRWLGAALL